MKKENGHEMLKWSLNALHWQVRETTRDVCFLHNEMFFAAAQKKYVYIYDKRGIEIHCMRVSHPSYSMPPAILMVDRI